MFRSTAFDKLLDKATSHLRLEPDWPTILQINDQIRQGDVQPKHVLASIKKKLINQNPHVAMFALIVLESCVKNCGSLIHDEIGTKVYMEQLRELVKTSPHENVKNKILELIQAWAFAFRNSPKYRAVQDTVNIMKAEEYKFPVLKESDAMFSADTAPEWADGECCHRCRVRFSLVQRKHHCRACGQVFCYQCSSRTCTLPKFGIEKEVRVCEACYNKTNRSTAVVKHSSTEELPAEYLSSSLAQQNQDPPPRKTEDELREEEELQLALALSQSEAEQKDKQKSGRSLTPTTRTKTHSPTPVSRDTASPPMEDADPDLARYLNRSYWENRTTDDSKPPGPHLQYIKESATVEQNGMASDSEMEEFVRDLKGQVEIFVNRMKSNSSRGRSIANDSSVQKLFMNITAMHSKLLHYIQQQDDSRVYYEGLQDKMVQVKDARAALDALREEHREKLRREAEIAERQRQHQMAQKLDIMRKKKQEYLQYQRQLTLQRIQEQEREMQMRQEQQKQQYLMSSQYGSMGYMPPGGFDTVPVGGYVLPPGYPHYPPPQGMTGIMMTQQGYVAQQPGAPPMMRPHMGQIMPPMGNMPSQPLGHMLPNTSPAHMPASVAGPMPVSQGQIPSGQGQMPSGQGQMSGGQGQMPVGQGQMPVGQGQTPGGQGQIPSQIHMQCRQGQIHGHVPGYQSQVPTAQGQIPQSIQGQMPNSQTTTQGGIPSQLQNPAVSHLPNQGQPQIISMSQNANVPINQPTMSPIGQPFQQQPPAANEETAELISFD